MFCILTDLFPFYPSNCSRAQCWVNKHQKIYLFQRLVEAGNIQDKSYTITQHTLSFFTEKMGKEYITYSFMEAYLKHQVGQQEFILF